MFKLLQMAFPEGRKYMGRKAALIKPVKCTSP